VTRKSDEERAGAKLHGKRADTQIVFDPPNAPHAKLCGQGPRAEARAARRLPRMTFGDRVANCNRPDAVTLATR